MGKALSRPGSLRDDAKRAEHAVTELEVYAQLGTPPKTPVENAGPSPQGEQDGKPGTRR